MTVKAGRLLAAGAAILLAVGQVAAGEPQSGSPKLKSSASAGAELRITPLRSYPAPISEEMPLRFELSMNNVSSHYLGRQEMVATILSPEGELKGFHGFDLTIDLPPGGERQLLYKTDNYLVSPEDAVIISGAEEEGSSEILSTTAAGPGDLCFNRCGAKEASCDVRCTCGVLEFSCSCGGGGAMSYTCKCKMCN